MGICAGLIGLAGMAYGQILPGSPTMLWAPVFYANHPDPFADQQTGSSEADIIGDANHPSLYMRYHDGGWNDPAAGWIAFRLRLAADVNPPGFTGAAFVGIDASLDGRLDLFVGVNNQGSGDHVGIWNPGNGQNISPSTTTIITPPVKSYTETTNNYSFMPVTATSDPTALSYDLDGGGRTDQFLTFVLPFADLVQMLAARGIQDFTKDSPMRLVAATATQANSLNQDLNGVTGGVNSSSTWEQLGAISMTYSASSITPIPEPSPAWLVAAGGMMVLCWRWRRGGQK